MFNMVSGGHNSRECERRQIAYENEETTFEHPAQPRADTGLDAGDEFDGVCRKYNKREDSNDEPKWRTANNNRFDYNTRGVHG